MSLRSILATEKKAKKQRRRRRREKRQENISKGEKNPGIRGNTDAHRKASQGYHHALKEDKKTGKTNELEMDDLCSMVSRSQGLARQQVHLYPIEKKQKTRGDM